MPNLFNQLWEGTCDDGEHFLGHFTGLDHLQHALTLACEVTHGRTDATTEVPRE